MISVSVVQVPEVFNVCSTLFSPCFFFCCSVSDANNKEQSQSSSQSCSVLQLFCQAAIGSTRMGSVRIINVFDPRRIIYSTLFCQSYSAFGLSRRQASARFFFVAGTLLKGLCLLLPVLISTGIELCEASGLHLHHFQGRPDWVSSEPLEHKYSDWWKVEDYSNWSRHHRNDLCSGGTHLDEDLPAGFTLPLYCCN